MRIDPQLGEQDGGRASGAALLTQARAIEQQIEYQLARARSAVGQKYAGRGVEIPDVGLPILRAMRRLHPDKQFTREANDCEGVILPINAVDFAEVLAILLDNAGKWARTNVALTFSCDASGGCTTRIVDDGPGIPEALLKEAFEVGSRFDPEMAGTGLGLAIAKDLCGAIGADLNLSNGVTGLIAELRLTAEKPERV